MEDETYYTSILMLLGIMCFVAVMTVMATKTFGADRLFVAEPSGQCAEVA